LSLLPPLPPLWSSGRIPRSFRDLAILGATNVARATNVIRAAVVAKQSTRMMKRERQRMKKREREKDAREISERTGRMEKARF
jgi:hypothetical protein